MALLFLKKNRFEVANYHYHEVDRQKSGRGAGTRSRDKSQILFPDPELTYISHKKYKKNFEFRDKFV